MAVDLYHGRRNNFRRCLYWIATEVRNTDKWALENVPSGVFYAKESTGFSNQGQQLNNVVLIDKDVITLETNDDVTGLTRGCIVQYLNKTWMVDTVQIELHNKETEYESSIHGTTYISIRR